MSRRARRNHTPAFKAKVTTVAAEFAENFILTNLP